MIAEVNQEADFSEHPRRRNLFSPAAITVVVIVLGAVGFGWGIAHHHKPKPAAAATSLPSALSNGVQIPAGSNLTPDEINALQKNSAASTPPLTVK